MIRGSLSEARRHFRRAVRMHPDEHEFQFALARVEYELGNLRRASRYLGRARSIGPAHYAERYQAKLDSINEARER
ncbi:tetratricopeptide repeat protein [Natronospira sp.]